MRTAAALLLLRLEVEVARHLSLDQRRQTTIDVTVEEIWKMMKIKTLKENAMNEERREKKTSSPRLLVYIFPSLYHRMIPPACLAL
jgi:hypothetical protein